MEIKTPMVFVKHITAAQRGNENSIRYLCDHTSSQFVKICRKYNLTDSEVAEVLDKAYGRIFADIKSVKDPFDFMSWADGLVRECCEEMTKSRKKAPAAKPKKASSKKVPAKKKTEPTEEPKTSAPAEEAKAPAPVEEPKVSAPVEAPKAAAAGAASAVSAKSAEQILKEVEAAVSASEEEGVFEDTRPAVSPEQAAPAAAAPKADAPKADAGTPETPVARQAAEETKK